MKRIGSRLLCILLLLSLLLSLTACGKSQETQLEKTAGYLQAQVTRARGRVPLAETGWCSDWRAPA